MRFKTVSEIIEFSRATHQALSRQYAELEQLATNAQAQQLLDHLNRHEQYMAQALGLYEQDAARGVLDTWLQYSPDNYPRALADLVDKVRSAGLNDVRDIVRVALAVDGYLVDMYREVIEKTDVATVRDVFANLLQMEQNQRRHIAGVIGPFVEA